MKFAVMFGNRGFFPGELIASARRDFASVLKKHGHEALMMDESLSRNGAVETPEEGQVEKNLSYIQRLDEKTDIPVTLGLIPSALPPPSP